MNKRLYTLLFVILLSTFSCSTIRFSSYQKLDHNLHRHALIKRVLDSFNLYESQVIYTQINRDKNNNAHFKSFTWNVDPDYYFYPASMVKMPAALIATEKINLLNRKYPELNLYSSMRYQAGHTPQTEMLSDSLSWNHQVTLAQFIKRIFIVSDNDAYNRTYEFIGQAELNDRLKELGYRHTHIIHRLDAPAFDFESNKYTNPIEIAEEDRMIYTQNERYNAVDVRVPNLRSLHKGKGYVSNDQTFLQPFDFSNKNYFSLQDMTDMIQSILFPGSNPGIKPFELTKDQTEYIRTNMSKLPRESKQPLYDSTHYDGYCKFFMYGDSKKIIPEHIRIFNKVGWAYGYLTDAAYIVDFKNNIEFMLSATVNTNTDGIYNDGIYAYETIGLPYLSELGSLFYQHELKRKRTYLPDLTVFKLDYKE